MQYRGRNIISAKPMSMASDTYMITFEDGSVGIAHKNALFGDQNTEAIKKVVEEIRPLPTKEITEALKIPSGSVVSPSEMKKYRDMIPTENSKEADMEEFDSLNEAQKQKYLEDSEEFIKELESEGKDSTNQINIQNFMKGRQWR